MTRTSPTPAPRLRLQSALALVAVVYPAPLWAEHEPAHDPLQHHESARASAPARAAVTLGAGGADPAASAVRYTCPMHPEVVSDTPGRCPHCGMKLIEREKAPEPGAGARPRAWAGQGA